MRLIFSFLLLPYLIYSQSFSHEEMARWEKQSQQVTIIRDHYGVPHIYGKTDADAVFGLLYAQCEDDFKRVELNYIEKLGRLAEVAGKDKVYDDLLIRLIIDEGEAKKDFQKAPDWFKKLCIAFADGINYYLYKNPSCKPALLQKFEPWYPFLWTDGSIGAINVADIKPEELKSFYSAAPSLSYVPETEIKSEYREEVLTGSNGFAFSPKITASGHSVLYINPHVTFYFRPEVHMVSEEGLNAYGAVTWGQFFIYQGFNQHCGWMHTSSAVDVADTYAEKVIYKKNKWFYQYDGKERLVISKIIELHAKNGTSLDTLKIQALFTHHGPIMAKRNGNWISVRSDNRLADGLMQSWLRTKAKGLDDYKKTMDLKGNISNNTVYADGSGNIAYWHGNRIPVRDTTLNWAETQDGSTSSTEWRGYHDVNQIVQSINPPNGWLQNCNATPFTVAADHSPKREAYPFYMAPDGENFRGVNAVDVLKSENNYTIEKVISAGYNRKLAAFEVLVPALVKAFDQVAYEDTLFALLAGPIAVLKNWDYLAGTQSVATTLAIEWGQKVWPGILKLNVPGKEHADQVDKVQYFSNTADAKSLLQPLLITIYELQVKFGKWQVPWGEINRFQRISPDIDHKFDDTQSSIPVPFASSAWGMLPSYNSRTFGGSKKRYGVNGNSFVCAVEFGPEIKAKSLLAGGNSGDPSSPHFFDQGEMYSRGEFKDVLFYREDVEKFAKRRYQPGR
jgi:acyl-homoserine-lactone acylase